MIENGGHDLLLISIGANDAGPVGLTLALELARYRVPVRIVDKAAARSDKSKALAVWPRTLELLDRAGCARVFANTGLHSLAVNILSGPSVIAHVTLDGIESTFPFLLMLPQSDTERLLETHLESLGVSVERETELTEFVDTGDHVTCRLVGKDGGVESVDAPWLVGCDGAQSTVRKQLGCAFEGDTIGSRFVLADVHVAGLNVPATELAIFWHQDGVVVFFPIAPGRYRIIADTGPWDPAARHDPTLADIQAIVDQRGPGGVVLSSPVWLSSFGINERMVTDYRRGRVFLAGTPRTSTVPRAGRG